MNSNKKEISIIGTKGLPAKYGGFETLVEYLTQYLGSSFKIYVYCSKELFAKNGVKYYNSVRLYYLPIKANGPQSILYDSLSLLHAVIKNNTLLVLGVSGAILFPIIKLFPKKKLIVNIDGIEHKREKWNWLAKRYLKYAEKVAIKYADAIVSDNLGIKDYVFNKYHKTSKLIAYGGDHVTHENLKKETILKYGLPNKYAFKVCRIEPENNIEIILEAFVEFNNYPIVLIGNWKYSEYGQRIFKKFSSHKNLVLLNPVYDQRELNQIRSNCYVYIHGHSAGGTNPSLVEAMYLQLPVISFDVSFNRYTTQNQALYFKTKKQLIDQLVNLTENKRKSVAKKLYEIAETMYTWKNISNLYKELIAEQNP